MTSYQQVYLTSMVLIVSKTFVNLGAGNGRKAVRNYCFNSLAILKYRNDVMNANASPFNDRKAAADSRSPCDIFISRRMGQC